MVDLYTGSTYTLENTVIVGFKRKLLFAKIQASSQRLRMVLFVMTL